MKYFALLTLGFFWFHTVFAQLGTLSSGHLQNAGYSVYAIDSETGEVIFQTRQVSLVPASVMKVITTAVSIDVLGSDFQFHTQIGYTGKINIEKGLLRGDLVLKGGCDPAFYSEYFPDYYQGTFENWASELKNRGIKSVEGNLFVDLSMMQGELVPGGWLWEDIGNYYGAGLSALTYNDNTYKIHLSSPKDAGKGATIIGFTPTIDSLKLINNVFSADDTHDLTNIYGAPGSFSQVIEGSIPKGYSDFVVKASIPNPAISAANEFVKVLKSSGIYFSGNILTISNSDVSNFILIADKPSPPLRELIIPLNHESINLFAEHLLREIGRFRKNSTSLAESLTALKEFVTEKKIFQEGFYPTDGSGLSRSNALCSRTLVEILRHMYLSPNRDLFLKSLPLAGKTGTLQNSFKGSPLENNLIAKTGSMSRVRSLAGIFTNKLGRKVIFAVITNNFEGSQATMGHSMEEIVNELYSLSSNKEGTSKF